MWRGKTFRNIYNLKLPKFTGRRWRGEAASKIEDVHVSGVPFHDWDLFPSVLSLKLAVGRNMQGFEEGTGGTCSLVHMKLKSVLVKVHARCVGLLPCI